MKKYKLALYHYKFSKPKFENEGRNDSLVSNWSILEKFRGICYVHLKGAV